VSVLLVAVAGFGLNEQDVFADNPEQERLTAPLNPLVRVIVHVLVLLLPHAMPKDEGLHAMLKSPTGGAAVVKLNPEVNEPGPQPLFARARQKYVVVLFNAGETVHVLVATFAERTMLVNPESEAT